MGKTEKIAGFFVSLGKLPIRAQGEKAVGTKARPVLLRHRWKRHCRVRPLSGIDARGHVHSSLHERETTSEKSDLFGIHKSDHPTSHQAERCYVLHAVLLDKRIFDSLDTSEVTWITSAKTILALGAIHFSDR